MCGADPGDESYSGSQANILGGGPAHDSRSPLIEPSRSSTAQQAQRITSTAPGIPEASRRPAFMPAAREGSSVQAWVPRRRNWASFDALDDLPDLSGHQQAGAGKPSNGLPATRQPELAACQVSGHCSEALRPLTSSLRNVAPVSKDDRSALGTAQPRSDGAHTAASPVQGKLQCDDSLSSAQHSPSRRKQPDMSGPAKSGLPPGAVLSSEVPQRIKQAVCNAQAVPCASADSWAAIGREHQLQPTTAAATLGPRWKPFAAPRLAGKATGGEPPCVGEGAAHAARGMGSQGRPSGLQPAADGGMRQQDLARTACPGRMEAQHSRSSSTREQQPLDFKVTKDTVQRDAACTVDRSTNSDPVISDSWADSGSSEHNDVGHPRDVCTEQQVSSAARQHMLLRQEAGEQSSREGWRGQPGASPGRAARECTSVGVPGMGSAAQEGGAGQPTTRKRLKRLYDAPASLDADADTGSGHSTEVRKTWHARGSALQEALSPHRLAPDLTCMQVSGTLSQPLLRWKGPHLQAVSEVPADDALTSASSPKPVL